MVTILRFSTYREAKKSRDNAKSFLRRKLFSQILSKQFEQQTSKNFPKVNQAAKLFVTMGFPGRPFRLVRSFASPASHTAMAQPPLVVRQYRTHIVPSIHRPNAVIHSPSPPNPSSCRLLPLLMLPALLRQCFMDFICLFAVCSNKLHCHTTLPPLVVRQYQVGANSYFVWSPCCPTDGWQMWWMRHWRWTNYDNDYWHSHHYYFPWWHLYMQLHNLRGGRRPL